MASSESLAMLEIMVHLDDYSLLRHYEPLEAQLPVEDILHLPFEQLPDDWRDEPAPPSTADIGDAWLEEGKSLALAVPSVVVPRELNYLINPSHAQFKGVVANATKVDFQPDGRLHLPKRPQ